jgi:ribosomal protein S18 acetylase RimI-like enzyme
MTNPNLEIARAQPEDAEAWAKILKTAWLVTYPNEKYGIDTEDILSKDFDSPSKLEERRNSFVDSENGFYFVAKVYGQVIGLISGKNGEEINEIGAVYLLPEFQNKGIGKVLMEKAFATFKKQQTTKLTVVVYNDKAISFYQKFGFQVGQSVTDKARTTLPSGKTLPLVEMIKE